MNNKVLLLRALVLFVVFVFVSFLTTKDKRVFLEKPVATAKWEVATQYDNYIGNLINVTFRITTQRGVILDLNGLPDVGEVISFYPRPDGRPIDLLVPEGEVEVFSRRITESTRNGLVETLVFYELQYLQPIDLSVAFDDKVIPSIEIYQSYWLWDSDTRVVWRTERIMARSVVFYITPRVDEDSKPIFKFVTLEPSFNHWTVIELLGFSIIASVVISVVWQLVNFVIARQRRIREIADAQPDIKKLYELWNENFDKKFFKEALILYCDGVWGPPKAKLWARCTFVIYSGVRLSDDQIKNMFADLVAEVVHEHKP